MNTFELNIDDTQFLTLAEAVKAGFSKDQKKLSSIYFYDDTGSVLFQKITQQPEYYLTRSEHEILSHSSSEIIESLDSNPIDIIELGVGDGHKTQLLLQAFKKENIKVNFYPIDISKKAMHLLEDFLTEDDLLNIEGVVADYISGIEFIQKKSKHKKMILFLGSNIGNFDRKDALEMLKSISQQMNSGDTLLTGFDLKKDPEILTAAYNDKNGITRAFNLNLLTRMNNELGANFNLNDFHHYGVYNESLGSMESYLISMKDQEVEFKSLSEKYTFRKDEKIHLEYSYKYSVGDIEELAQSSGFKIDKNLFDEKKYFVDSLWQKI